MYALREYDARLAKEGKTNTSPNRFQRFIRAVASQIEELDMPAALDSIAVDPADIRLPKIPQISAENREKLNAAGSQIKSSFTNAAGNVRKLWVTMQQQHQERREGNMVDDDRSSLPDEAPVKPVKPMKKDSGKIEERMPPVAAAASTEEGDSR